VNISLCPKVDYINCRAVNPRRIDLRGAVSIKVKVNADRKQEVITDALGLNSQLKKEYVKYAGCKTSGEKQMLLSEETEINSSKPPIQSIVSTDAVILPGDKKVVANKVIAKGDVKVNILYSCEKDGIPGLEPLEVSIPYSQIIDVEGVDENYDVSVLPSLANIESTATGGSDGSFKRVNLEIIVLLCVKASKPDTTEIVTDAYSTSYPLEYSTSKIRLESSPLTVNDSSTVKSDVQVTEGEITSIHDVWTDITNVNVTPAHGEFTVTGTIHNTVIATNSEGLPFTIESSQPFDLTFQCDDVTENSIVEVDITPAGTQYTLNTGSSISIKNDLRAVASVTNTVEYDVLTDMQIDDTIPFERDRENALTLYYGSQGESLWDIAKHYNSSVESIIEENEELDNITCLPANSMVMIPILV
jgi:hypothetical protein